MTEPLQAAPPAEVATAAPKVTAGAWVYDPDYDCMVPKEVRTRARRNYFNEVQSDLASPAVHAGGMPAVKSMADGRTYDTKRNYQKSVTRAGCEIVGFDRHWQEHIKPQYDEKKHMVDVVGDVKRALEEQSSRPSR